MMERAMAHPASSSSPARWSKRSSASKRKMSAAFACATSKPASARNSPSPSSFSASGHIPNAKMFHGQLDLDADGYILTHSNVFATRNGTPVPGVFACGDIQDRRLPPGHHPPPPPAAWPPSKPKVPRRPRQISPFRYTSTTEVLWPPFKSPTNLRTRWRRERRMQERRATPSFARRYSPVSKTSKTSRLRPYVEESRKAHPVRASEEEPWPGRLSSTSRRNATSRRLDKPIQREISRYLDDRIAPSADPKAFGHPLGHELSGLWRYRVRDYRILCEIHDKKLIILVVSIGHRSKI